MTNIALYGVLHLYKLYFAFIYFFLVSERFNQNMMVWGRVNIPYSKQTYIFYIYVWIRNAKLYLVV